MSGFLARLVARAQGRVSVAQPLVPPRFAPGLTRREASGPEASGPEVLEQAIVGETPATPAA
ncbi:MAG TPA: hypothetical protein VHE35_26685, partial [Kofleriaceae bacterium]|nr:hypothetical protein [Kofleriaceae bacterium]